MGLIRDNALSIWNAAVDAVRAKTLVQKNVRIEADRLHVKDSVWELSRFNRIVVVGAGKAATGMTQGLVNAVGSKLPISGWINVPEGTETPITGITVHPARPAGLNEPTEAGVLGTTEILKLVNGASDQDLCIALISGGGSALMPAPADGVSLADKQKVTRFLSGAGANIAELNTVRKHLSQVKGGGLAAVCNAGELITLVLSDVLGDPLDLIASGPTVPDTSTPIDALDVLTKYDCENTLAPSIRLSLQQAKRKEVRSNSQTIVIGNNQVAVHAASHRAEELNATFESESANACEGDAGEVGRTLAKHVISLLRGPGLSKTHCVISGGEPTVRLAPEKIRGKGGRNQQLVLSAYEVFVDQQLSVDEWKRVVMLSGGTDGEDGPTDAAGGFIDESVHREIVQQNLDVRDAIERNDAYSLLHKAGGLIVTGPTGTNVCDVRVAMVEGNQP